MKKNKLIKLVGVITLMIFCLIGCGNEAQQETEAEPEIVYADEAFVADFAKALENRWDLNDKDENSDDYEERVANDEEWKNMMLSYINAELDILNKYTEEKFEDSDLQELALKYVNLLKSHVEICDYIIVDYIKYDEEFQPIYDGRSKVIATLVENYGLTVSEKHQKTLDDFLTKSKLVEANENVKEEIQKMINNIVFEKVEDKLNKGGQAYSYTEKTKKRGIPSI